MANQKISQLPAIVSAASADYFPVVVDATTSNARISVAALLASVPIGSAASPSFAFNGDTNTGIYSPGADQVAISTNGTGRLFVDANGRVGVGLASPTDALSINGSINIAPGSGGILRLFETNTTRLNYLVAGADDSGAYFDSTYNSGGSGALVFRTLGSERMRLDSSGRLGLGNSAVTGTNTRLEVSNDSAEIKVSSTAAFNANFRGIRFGIAGDSYDYSGVRFQPNSGELRTEAGFAGWGGLQTFYTNGLERVRISSTGAVGIGTATVNAKLEVAGGNIRLDNNQGVEWGGGNNYIYGNESTDFIAIATNGNERSRWDSSGRLLVGTSTSSVMGENIQVNSSLGLTGTSTNQLNYYGTGFEVVNRNASAVGINFYVGAGGTAPVASLSTSGVWTNASDIRNKENVEDIHYGIETVKSLSPREFDVKANGRHAIGFIAQEVQELIPEVIHETFIGVTQETHLGLDYGSLTAVLTKALQEAIGRIESLEAEVAALKGV